jgi:hypothetical protein
LLVWEDVTCGFEEETNQFISDSAPNKRDKEQLRIWSNAAILWSVESTEELNV